jgi:hypothetical protein
MKKLGCALYIVVLLVVMGCAGQQSSAPGASQPRAASKEVTGGTPTPGQLYTAYNIWILPATQSHNMKCINYKYGNDILPAGTPVQKIRIGQEDRPYQEFIGFETVENNKRFKIYYNSSWHPGKKIEDFKNLMFTNQTFEEMTAGLTEREIKAIRSGIIVDGMTPKAVLIAYGYPPEHRTPTLDKPVWIYWRNKFATINVCFDENQKAITCK